MTRVAIYARYSSDKQREASIEDQIRLCEERAVREGWKIIQTCSDRATSGASLIRPGIQELMTGAQAGKFDLFGEPPGMRTNLASALLAPTKIYVKPLLNIIRDFDVHGMVHVTGGGFEGNVPRVLPAGVRARIDTDAWPRPEVYDWIAREGELPETELLRVFNCGIGMIIAVPGDSADEVLQRLRGLGERGYKIGTVERKTEEESAILFDPGFLGIDLNELVD